MNKVILSGRTTNDIELKATPDGTPVATFILAVDRRTKDDKADFPTIVAWRKTAEFVAQYITKGRKIIVEGELRTRTYEGEDGKRHKVTEVQAENIEFADNRPQEKKEDAPSGYDDGLPYDGPFGG